jgi:hypothetical protein
MLYHPRRARERIRSFWIPARLDETTGVKSSGGVRRRRTTTRQLGGADTEWTQQAEKQRKPANTNEQQNRRSDGITARFRRRASTG